MPISFKAKVPEGKYGEDIWIKLTNSTNTITEVGLFNDSSAGTMLIRRVMPKPITMVTTKMYKIEVEYAVEDL